MSIASYFQSQLSADEIMVDRKCIQSYLVDWRKRYWTDCCCVLRPKSVQSVQQIMRIAHQNHIPVTVQGGNTGMCGASIPSVENSVILLLEGLAVLRAFNPLDKTVTVEAGMVLARLQALVAAEGYYFPLSLASEGTCQIGGNIACNAGGMNVLRYGPMRDLVMGLEVVLPTGELVSHLASLHKNTTGVDSKHWWVGSEGTLGVITAATLKIFNQPAEKITLLVACEQLSEVFVLLEVLQYRYMNELTSFEYMSRAVFELSQNFSGLLFDLTGNDFVVCELSFNEVRPAQQERLYQQLMSLGFINTIIASSEREAAAIWKVRENVSDAQKHTIGVMIKHEIAVPISTLSEFIKQTEIKIKAAFPDAHIFLFGHLGDGSLHYNIALDRDHTHGVYQFEEALNYLVYNEVIRFSGTIAAEHGIGQLKKKWLSAVRTSSEIAAMKALKQVLDPHHIMNRGKILPD